MGTNRKLKTDGNLEIESAQVDINSDIDVTGDVGSTTVTTTGNATIGGDIDVTGDVGGATATITGDATIGGTLGVTGQATLSGLAFPTSDGTVGQALITDGSGTLSFGYVASGGGVDEITSATEAANYSGTNKIIRITGNATYTITAALNDRIIIVENTGTTYFEGQLYNCKIQAGVNTLHFRNTTSAITGMYSCEITCDVLYISNTGTGTSAKVSFNSCNINCLDMIINGTTGLGISGITNSNVYVRGETYFPDSSYQLFQFRSSKLDTDTLRGVIDLETFNGVINVREKTSNADARVKIAGTTYISGIYDYPFKVNSNGVDTNVIVEGERITSDQSITGGSITKIQFNNENIDSTNIFDPSTNYRITAKVKGYYKVTFHIYAFSITASLGHKILIYKNGASIGRDFISAVNVDGSLGRVNTCSYTLNLSVGDYIEFYSDCIDSDYKITHTYTWFQFEKIN